MACFISKGGRTSKENLDPVKSNAFRRRLVHSLECDSRECDSRECDSKECDSRELKSRESDFVMFGIPEKCKLKSWETNFDVFGMHVTFLRICH